MSVNGNFLLVIQPPADNQQPDHPIPALPTVTAGWPGPENARAAHRLQGTMPDGHRFDLQWQGAGWQYIGNEQVGAMGMSNGPHGDDLSAVLHAWMQDRKTSVERCLGRFVLVCWDVPRGLVTIVTDAFKTWPVCYAHEQDRLACASDM